MDRVLALPAGTLVHGLAPMALFLRKANGINRRELRRNRLPRVALIFGNPHRTRGRTESQAIARLIHVQRVAKRQVIRVLLR